MSQIVSPGGLVLLPTSQQLLTGTTLTIVLNAIGETLYFIGTIILENPLSSSKTISAAGGGSIVWHAGISTFANGGSTFKVGIQDVSTASSPVQGDGTFDVEASFTGGGGGITSSAVNTSVMTSGTKTIANGDLIAITLSMTARGGADSVTIYTNVSNSTWDASNIPCVVANTGGSYARQASYMPRAYIVFNDGTIGWLFGNTFHSTTGSVTYNSGTGTADEYGMLIKVPHTFYATGVKVFCSYAGNSSDMELLLYSDPLGTPVAERTITVDATQIAATGTNLQSLYAFTTPFMLKANTAYAVTARPTTANNITMFYEDTNSSTGGKTGAPNATAYAVRRLDNSGAFSDYNGGTATTRQMGIGLLGTYMEQGVNMCSGQVGVF